MAKKKTTKRKKRRRRTIKNLDKLRIIPLFKNITPATSAQVIEKLLIFNSISKKKPITILIDSPGGTVLDGLAIIDAMRSVTAPVRTIIMGKACSIAGIISVVADERVITRNSFWMGHPMVGGSYDYLEFVRDRIKFNNKLEEKVINILKARTKLSKDDLRKIERGELWLDALQAAKRGVVDKVI